MINTKCLKCKHPISKKWILLSGSNTEYKCPKCECVYTWTKYKNIHFWSSYIFGLFLSNFIMEFYGDLIKDQLVQMIGNNIFLIKMLLFIIVVIFFPVSYFILFVIFKSRLFNVSNCKVSKDN